MSTDIVFINPPSSTVVYQDLGPTLAAIEPPTWLRMISGYVYEAGFDIEIIDADALRLTPEQTAYRAVGLDPRFIVIVAAGQQPSASTQTMSCVGEVIDLIDDAVPVCLIGHHVSARPYETMLEFPKLSFVLDGEGTHGLAQMLKNKPLATIPGLFWKTMDGVATSSEKPALTPIDEMSGDVWHRLPMEAYRAHNWHCWDGQDRQPYASIYTTLGCPYKCSFCMINVIQHANRYRARRPESVVDEISKLAIEYGVRNIKIADEMFILNDAHVHGVCEGIVSDIPRSVTDDLNIWCYARVDSVKKDQLALLRRAGIRWIALGIESGSAHVRDGAHKAFTDEDIIEVVREIQQAGIHVLGNFIFGLPDDTLDSMSDTLKLALDLRCEYANFYSAMAYPGSPLFDEVAKKNPEVLPNKWSGYSQHSFDCTPLPTETLSSRTVLAFRDHAFQTYFEDSQYLDYVRQRFGRHVQAGIEQMTSVPMRRALLS